MRLTVDERLRAFRARSLAYERLGHDRLAAARFVVDAARLLSGPVLDLGTGKGLLAVALARRGLPVVSIDLDEQERELARLLADEAAVTSRITFLRGDGANLPCADGAFGCAAMMDVLHHLQDPVPVLREMARVVAPGGILLVADFDEDGFALVSRVHRAEGGEHPRTAVTVPSVLEQAPRLGLRCTARVGGHQHDVLVLQRARP